MTDSDKNRDILDLSGVPDANKPVQNVTRPMADPAESAAFLNDFLEQKPEADASAEGVEAAAAQATATARTAEKPVQGTSPEAAEVRERVIEETLKSIYDPEIPVNVYDMGLIYEVIVEDNFTTTVIMTLTTPHCPVAESMPGEIELRVNATPGVMGAEVRLVWEPAWDMSRLSEEARLELGLL